MRFLAPHTTATIEGLVHDTQNNNLANVHVSAVATIVNGTETLTFTVSGITDGNGHYSLAVFPGTWTVSVSSDDLQAQSFLGIADKQAVVASGSFNLNFSAPLTTSTIHGSVRTPANALPPFLVQVTAFEIGGDTFATTMTDANGDYVLHVTAGTWDVGASNTPGFIPERQTVIVPPDNPNVPLIIHPITAHLRGQVTDNQNNPVAKLELLAHDSAVNNTSVNATTDSNGNFDIGVYGGEGVTPNKQWTLQVALGGAPATYVSGTSNASFLVTDAVDINDIPYSVFIVTAHLRGQVIKVVGQNETPVGNVAVFASGITHPASSGSDVDEFGFFDIPVLGGDWTLGVSNLQGLGLVGQVLPISVADGVDANSLALRVRPTNPAITGTVKDAQNNPISGIQVSGNATLTGSGAKPMPPSPRPTPTASL